MKPSVGSGAQTLASGRLRKACLRSWHQSRKRIFPWRVYESPWHVLLAEMLLLRTRAEIVAKRIDEIIRRYPTPAAMATEDSGVVEDSLGPFGLRWRARRLHELAQRIVTVHRGDVPVDLDSLLDLPGVGPYVASATLAALTGRPVLLTDTNTVRVAKRVAGITALGDLRRRSDMKLAVNSLLGGRANAADWLAVIDLAATVCRPRNPKCHECPIRQLCTYGATAHQAAAHHSRVRKKGQG
jgi:A/G-specific adenine glycosylase